MNSMKFWDLQLNLVGFFDVLTNLSHIGQPFAYDKPGSFAQRIFEVAKAAEFRITLTLISPSQFCQTFKLGR